jgi:hypothetical protein
MNELEISGYSRPSEVLAREIVDRLIAEGLVAREKRDTLVLNLAAGTLTAEDWRLHVEIAADKEKGG